MPVPIVIPGVNSGFGGGPIGLLNAAILAVAAGAWAVVEAIMADNAKREQYSQNFVSQFSQAYPDYNVVIVHTEHVLSGIYVHMHLELPLNFGTVGYEIYASPKGRPFTFTLTGDGGYINWAFEGEFNQDSGTITAIEHGSFLWASFTGTDPGQPVLLCCSADGANWSDYIFVRSPAGSIFAPSLAVFNNRFYVALISPFLDIDPPRPQPNQLIVSPWPDGGTGPIFVNQLSLDAPSLAVFNNRLYVAFVGTDPGRPLLVCSSADGVNWTNYTRINQYSSTAPSLAVFNNRLYVGFVGTNPGRPLVVCSSPDGANWTNYTYFNQQSSFAPSLAVFNNRLYVGFVGTAPGRPLVVCSSADGANWTNYTNTNQFSQDTPSLAVFNNRLYVGFVGTDPGRPLVVCSSADGTHWTNYTSTNQFSHTAPSLGAWV